MRQKEQRDGVSVWERKRYKEKQMSMVKIEIQREHNDCERERERDSYGILLYTHNNYLLQ